MIYATKITRDFYVTCAALYEFKDKLYTNEFQQFLSGNLKILDYSEEVKQYQFVFIAVPPENRNHDKWRKYFSRKRGILYHNLKLDFEQFQKANTAEAYQMQAELYLRSITEISTLRGMKKVCFDAEKFYEDVQRLFLEEGWLKPENQLI